ncbi:ankyrin [Fusarium beomiforme]|uniref:Ankyrin n=1 Tax=Fusarium beomiforme TaxID=44412 RepID=A0A9P5A7D7_9HYPO|nr:ankyrin [Fusarium beomiforme]
MAQSLAVLSTIPERQAQLITLLENLAPSTITLEQRTSHTITSQPIQQFPNMKKPDEKVTTGASRTEDTPVPDASSGQVTESISTLKLEFSRFQKRGWQLRNATLGGYIGYLKGEWHTLVHRLKGEYLSQSYAELRKTNYKRLEAGHHSTSPLEWAWVKILGGVYDQQTQVEMEELFNDRECLEEMRFPPLHRLILGLDPSSLEEYLSNNIGQVDSVDGSGRTALSWAAQRGMTNAVTTLLRHGANPNINTPNGHSPLMFASEARNPDSIRLLLIAGADVSQCDIEGQTALHYAAGHWDDLAYYEPLVEYGSDVNWPTVPRLTPLTTVIIGGHNNAMKYLVANGADVDMKSHDGRSPAFYAVEYNNHTALKFLHDKGADFRGYSDAYPSVIHVAAYHADVETLRILTSYHLVLEDVECIDSNGLTVLQIVEQRMEQRNFETGFIQAFELLLQSVASEQVEGLESRSYGEKFYDAMEYL